MKSPRFDLTMNIVYEKNRKFNHMNIAHAIEYHAMRWMLSVILLGLLDPGH